MGLSADVVHFPANLLKIEQCVGILNEGVIGIILKTEVCQIHHGGVGGAADPLLHGFRIFAELGAQFEYSFFAYGTGAGYKDSRRLAPYILAGVGLTYAPKPANHVVAMNLPVGIGVKYKLAERLNVGAEWTMRFTTSDRLDVTHATGLQLDDPYGIESGLLKNRDSYSWLMLYVSYDMFPKYRKCNN